MESELESKVDKRFRGFKKNKEKKMFLFCKIHPPPHVLDSGKVFLVTCVSFILFNGPVGQIDA